MDFGMFVEVLKTNYLGDPMDLHSENDHSGSFSHLF